MKKLLFYIFTLLFIPFATSQTWTYKSTGNDFDGKIRTSSVVGKGGEFPYTSPRLVINFFENDKSLNFYITDMGYTGCDDNKAVLLIDGSKRFKTVYVSDDAENTTLFFDNFESINSDEIGAFSLLEMLQLLKTGSKLSIRVANDCYQRDYSFSLTGSTSAINFVLGRDFDEQIEEVQRRRIEKSAASNVLIERITLKLGEPNQLIDANSKLKIIDFVTEATSSSNISIHRVKEINVQYIDYNKWYVEILIWPLDSQISPEVLQRKIIQF